MNRCAPANPAFGELASESPWYWTYSLPSSLLKKILEEYPQLSQENVLACVTYEANMSRGRFVDVPLERPA